MKNYRIDLIDDQQNVIYTRIEYNINYSAAENLAKWYVVSTIATGYKITEI